MPDSEFNSIAIIGMSGRFPGADTIDDFWKNIRDGVETISSFTDDELIAAGVPLHPDRYEPNYVRARSILKNRELFDAKFFGYSPREAAQIDPQQRLFLECAWEAMENGGYDPKRYEGSIGVFAGCYLDTYIFTNLCTQPGFLQELLVEMQVGHLGPELGNDKDHIATRAAYKLDLKGPAINVQTACSTSLVAVCQAVQSLLTHSCDMALAGGAALNFRHVHGYLHQEGGMLSSDGHCRAYDHRATGTVFGEGVGVVLLKRLEDAITDRDTITAVIRGIALNNDGGTKMSYAAPSADGQAEAIAMAHAFADVDPATITYVEGHGTGTPLGDPIEVTALTQAFRAGTDRRQFCALGSLKPNIGHLDVASGVAGLIKTALALKHRIIPPLINFEAPNPNIDFGASPFFIPTKPKAWETESGIARRAGVSSFGVGGTNAHVILEEAQTATAVEPSERPELLILSAKTPETLEAMGIRLADHLRNHPEQSLSDIAYTLQVGRREFSERRTLVARDSTAAISILEGKTKKRTHTGRATHATPPVVFMFPGQGAQRLGMGAQLYKHQPEFREIVDRCSDLLKPHLGFDLRDKVFRLDADASGDPSDFNRTMTAQPALFVTEYALARMMMSWGIQPTAMIGHSVGEFVAGCLAGVFSLEDALLLIAIRARLVDEMPAGSMLAVRLSESELAVHLDDELEVAACNAPNLTVVAGGTEKVVRLQNHLSSIGHVGTLLDTSHAFHSQSMAGVVPNFSKTLASISLQAPRIPYVSTVTGDWVTDSEATSADFWARQVREKVRFADGIAVLLANPANVFLEIGPGSTLATLTRQHPQRSAVTPVISCLPRAGHAPQEEVDTCIESLGQLWASGCAVNWTNFHRNTARGRVSIPTYPFERQPHWIAPLSLEQNATAVVTRPASEQSAPEPELVELPPDTDSTEQSEASIRNQVALLLHGLSGIEIPASAHAANLLDLGFDSLLLTQVRQSIQTTFKVRISFRSLMEELNSVEALGAHLYANLPPELSVQPKPTHSPTGKPKDPRLQNAIVADQAGLSDSPITAQILRQLDSIQRELAALRSGSDLKRARSTPGRDLNVKDPKSAPEVQPVASHGPFKPMARGRTDGLSAHQKACLQKLNERYTARTRRSKEYTQTHRKHFCDPRAAGNFRQLWKEMVYPIVADHSKGSRLWDIDGNEYVDVTLGFGVHFLGHSPDFVLAAIREQLEKGTEIGPQSVLAGEVARLVTELTGMERVTFCNTGSEAVMAAIRVARTVTARNKIVMFSGDYHGMFDSVLTRGFKVGDHWKTAPIAPGIPQSQVEDMIVLEFNSDEALEYIRLNSEEIAAVLVEPVQARNPDIQPREFLHALRDLTNESGIIYIFDEVITGFRCAPGGAQEYFDIRADLATYGKIAGGGIPIGILAGRSEFMDVLDGGFWQFGDDSFPEVGVTFFAGTFVRHPLAMAAAHAVLVFLKEKGPSLQKQLSNRAQELVRDLNGMFREIGVPLHLMNFCSLMHYELDPKWEFGGLLFYYLREQGVHIWEGRLGFISIAHDEKDLDFLRTAFRRASENMLGDGFLPEQQLHDKLTLPEGAIALTPAQREVWLASQFSPDASNAFIESDSLVLQGPLNTVFLAEAFSEMVQRHDAFRARFNQAGYQTFDAARFPSLETLDLRSLPSSERETKLQDLIVSQVSLTFDLETGPLLRAHLVQTEPEEHVLLIVAHHLACDGWSFGVIFRELAEIYTAKTESRAAHLPEAAHFSKYAQNHASTHEDSEDAGKYWRSRFETIPSALELPTDHPRPAARTWNGERVTRVLDHAKKETVALAAKSHSTTSFAFLLSVFQVLLHRLNAAEDIVVGIYDAGQASTDNRNLVGHCVNLLPLRFAISPAATFSQTLKQTKGTLFEAIDHRDFTFGQILEAVKVPRDSSRSPLVSTVFNLDPRIETLTFGPLECALRSNPRQFYQFDLGFNLVESSDSLRIECDFNNNLFSADTIHRWISYYERLLESACKSPDIAAGNLNLLSDNERTQLLAWGSNVQAEPKKTVLELIREQAVAHSSKVAVLSTSGSILTYEELWQTSGRIAAALQQRGVTRGSKIGVCLGRTINLPATLLAIWRTGACYVPLNAEYPPVRLAEMISESGIGLVVLDEASVIALPERTKTFLVSEALSGTLEPPQSSDVQLDDLAYIIFTSGSTGRPKGVAVPHGSLASFVESMRLTPGCTESDRVLAITTLSFDIAGLELFLPLSVGAQLVLAPAKAATDADALIEAIHQLDITIMQATPVTWRSMIALNWRGRKSLKALIGGESLPPDLAEALVPLCGELWNMYGPTETTIWSTVERITTGKPPISIGRPIANTFAYVANSLFQLQPIGVPGELFLGGLGVAKGYINSRELTEAKFVPDPFQKGAGTSMFRTGDLARWLPDGRLECLGRLDRQIKIRGFRIERDEVEGALRAHPKIANATTAVRAGRDGIDRLVAYYVSHGGIVVDTSELRQHLESILPNYMIPGAFVPLSVIPLTPSGKTNENALPDLIEASTAKEAPRNSTELQLLEIWEELLGCTNVGIRDNFFELGGHSLMAARMVVLIEERLGIRISLQTLFEGATIAHLADFLLADLRLSTGAESISAVQREGARTPVFFFHGDFVGGGFFCHELAKFIQSDRPFYAVHPHGMDGKPSPTSVESMAAERVAQIRSIQPKGPYILGGYCNGGLAAFEAARILAQQGETVSGVILINVDGSNYRYRHLRSLARLVSNILGESEDTSAERFFHWTEKVGFIYGSLEFQKVSLRTWWRYPIAKRLSRASRKLKRIAARLFGGGADPSSAPAELTGSRHVLSELYHRASASYVPQPFAGKVALLWSQSEPGPEGLAPDFGWSSSCAGLELYLVPGNHHTSVSMRRNLQVIGRKIGEIISKFESPEKPGPL